MTRWLPTVLMMLVSLISYIDRNTLALLSPTILRETGLNAEQYGYIISAFSIAYMIGNPVWGVLLDRLCVRLGMSLAVSFWTIASVAHAFARGLPSFAAARAMLGFGEGATFPGGLRTAMQTLPESARSRGIAVAYSGGSLGALVTPLIITPIAARWGWRGAFWFTGLIGFGWLALWVVMSRGAHHAALPRSEASIQDVFRDARAWAFMSAYALGALPLAFVLYGAAIYLAAVKGLTQIQIGYLLWIPPLGWEAGYFFWGWISDRWVRPRRLTYEKLFPLCALLSLPLAAAWLLDPVWMLMLELFFAMFIAAGFVIISVAYATDALPPGHAGLIAGMGAGSWSALVALVMPVFGRLFDLRRYDLAFVMAAIFPLLGYLCWRLLAQRKLHTLA